MVFRWWRKRRRKQLALEPFPAEWSMIVQRNCRQFAGLTPVEQTRFLRDIRWFVDEKNIEGSVDLKLTDEIRVTIAAHAALIGLGFPEPPFDRLMSIIVRPESYVMKTTHNFGGSLNIVSDEARIGEAWKHGPVVLSWEDIQQQCRDEPDGRNVILHELAHLLDMENAEVDGVPVMKDREQYERWKRVNDAEYRQLVRDIQQGYDTLIDTYGGTSPTEFFAVVTETFFEEPRDMKRFHPELYEVFREYYRQDPAVREMAF